MSHENRTKRRSKDHRERFALRCLGAVLALAVLWPVAAAAEHAAGTTDRSRATVNPLRYAGPALKSFSIETMTTWCHLGAEVLQVACGADGTYRCGPEVEVACGHRYPGGFELLAAGVGLRNSGTGTLELRGAPPGSQVVASWVIWGLIVGDEASDPGDRITFDGQPILGRELGTSAEPCWEEDSENGGGAIYKAYWADVTPYLRGENVNGDYSLTLPGSSLTGGEDPWRGPPGTPAPLAGGFLAEGASLVVVVAHPEIATDSIVALHAGPSFLADSRQYVHHLELPVPASARDVRHLRIGADGQTRTRERPVATYHTLLRAGNGLWVTLRGEGSEIDPNHDWLGADGGPIDQLWDTQLTYARIEELGLLPDETVYSIGYEPQPLPPWIEDPRVDCVAVTLHGLGISSRVWDDD